MAGAIQRNGGGRDNFLPPRILREYKKRDINFENERSWSMENQNETRGRGDIGNALVLKAKSIPYVLWHEINELIDQAEDEQTREKLKFIQCEKRLRDMNH